jgi:hypothetical protein
MSGRDLGGRGAGGAYGMCIALRLGCACRGRVAADMVELSEETSAAVLPMRVIFLPARSARGVLGALKGGFWRPSLEAMRNFWFEGGMKRSVATRSERSDMVASCAKENVCRSPWCSSVICSSSTGADVESTSVIVARARNTFELFDVVSIRCSKW